MYSRDRFEVIVVDDGSHTLLDAIVNQFSDQLAVKLITQPNSGPAVARNRGAAEVGVVIHQSQEAVGRNCGCSSERRGGSLNPGPLNRL
jgi:hypothetical protein